MNWRKVFSWEVHEIEKPLDDEEYQVWTAQKEDLARARELLAPLEETITRIKGLLYGWSYMGNPLANAYAELLSEIQANEHDTQGMLDADAALREQLGLPPRTNPEL
jgi:adenosylmethionine-8-amino-7-oxononanoate aminotransferase